MVNWEELEQKKRMERIVEIMRKELEKAHQKPTADLTDSEVLIVHQYYFLNKLDEKLEVEKTTFLKNQSNFLETLLVVQKNQIQNNQDVHKLILEVKENNSKKTNNCSCDYKNKEKQALEKWFKVCLKEMRWILIFIGFLAIYTSTIGIVLSLKN